MGKPREEGALGYLVVVIDPHGPGRALGGIWETLEEVQDWLEETGEAYEHSLGVAIHDITNDTYDCDGLGEFSPVSECWG